MTIASPAGFQVIAVPADAPSKPGLIRRVYDAIFESRERNAQRAIEDFLARRGHRLTDSVEREINNRMLDSQWPKRTW